MQALRKKIEKLPSERPISHCLHASLAKKRGCMVHANNAYHAPTCCFLSYNLLFLVLHKVFTHQNILGLLVP